VSGNPEDIKMVSNAMANITRRNVMKLLADDDKTVKEIEDAVDKSMLDYHFKILDQAGQEKSPSTCAHLSKSQSTSKTWNISRSWPSTSKTGCALEDADHHPNRRPLHLRVCKDRLQDRRCRPETVSSEHIPLSQRGSHRAGFRREQKGAQLLG